MTSRSNSVASIPNKSKTPSKISSVASMPKEAKCLFLFEVLVTKIIFTDVPCVTDKNFRTCIRISFPGLNPIEIYEDEGNPNNNDPFVQHFNKGKSCLFILSEGAISQAMSKCQVKVVIEKSLPCGCLPASVVIGECLIDITKEFVQARKNYLQNPVTCSYQALKDSFVITNANGEDVGEVPMFLRITCFGRNITTTFQGGQNNVKMFGEGGQAETQKNTLPCICDVGQGGICPRYDDPYNSMPCQGGPCDCPPINEVKAKIPPGAKDCCPPGNKIIFQLPLDTCGTGHKQRTHFNFDSNGVGDIEREDFEVKRADPYPGVVYDFPSQIIKVRIGKTVELQGRKSKFEYQFITPTTYQPKSIPVTDIGTAQCNRACDCCVCRNASQCCSL